MDYLTSIIFGSLLLTLEHGSEAWTLTILVLVALIFSREGDIVVTCSKNIKTIVWGRHISVRPTCLVYFFKSALELSVCYLLIAHVSIWFVTKWQHLPHDNSKAPDITGWGKNPMSNGLWCCPSDGNLTTLWKSRDTEYPACIIELYFSSASVQEAYKVVQRLGPLHLKWRMATHGEISQKNRNIPGNWMSLSSLFSWMLHKTTAVGERA